jgi:hypothetical protein
LVPSARQSKSFLRAEQRVDAEFAADCDFAGCVLEHVGHTMENRTLKAGSSLPRAEEEIACATVCHTFDRFPYSFLNNRSPGSSKAGREGIAPDRLLHCVVASTSKVGRIANFTANCEPAFCFDALPAFMRPDPRF